MGRCQGAGSATGRRVAAALAILIGLALGLGALGCGSGEGDGGSGASKSSEPPVDPHAPPSVDAAALAKKAAAVFGKLPAAAEKETNPLTPAKIDLGRMLYYDTRLSKNHDVACNSCHKLDAFGVDGEPTSPGHRGQRGERNSPTVYNAALHLAQFWDGRAEDVEAQAKGPVLNPIEMASPSEEHVVGVLASIPGYVTAFAEAFPDDETPLSYDNMARAIGAFERKLITPGPFDRFLAGDLDALDPAERRGLDAFLSLGCISCHNGATVGGLQYRKLGQIFPYETKDPGRFNVTGNEADRFVFKVPSLRNVAETGPWFHDGSITSLEEAVRLMGYHQLGLTLEPKQIADLSAFLRSLTGEIDAGYVARPELPANGPDTPAPDPN
ncbi:MAG: c-type cytochrome [Spirochaetaceae bacterium]|nr:c-type cytochrome [Myxococcales bacterium]MCB9725880.1 c-type cytochrome [Spirochaetaceae bacterium]